MPNIVSVGQCRGFLHELAFKQMQHKVQNALFLLHYMFNTLMRYLKTTKGLLYAPFLSLQNHMEGLDSFHTWYFSWCALLIVSLCWGIFGSWRRQGVNIYIQQNVREKCWRENSAFLLLQDVLFSKWGNAGGSGGGAWPPFCVRVLLSSSEHTLLASGWWLLLGN